MATIFTKIINGEIPSYKVAEDARFFAFLDINPLNEGHTLVVPKIETDYVFDLDNDTLTGLILFSRKVAVAIESVVNCKRIGVAIVGLEVPHVHVHLIPMNTMDDINFLRPKLKFTPEEFRDIAAKINQKLIL
jgi:histidine triad (HIT) family protein